MGFDRSKRLKCVPGEGSATDGPGWFISLPPPPRHLPPITLLTHSVCQKRAAYPSFSSSGEGNASGICHWLSTNGPHSIRKRSVLLTPYLGNLSFKQWVVGMMTWGWHPTETLRQLQEAHTLLNALITPGEKPSHSTHGERCGGGEMSLARNSGEARTG